MTRYNAWVVSLALLAVGYMFDYPDWALVGIAVLTGLLYGWSSVYNPAKQDVEDPEQEKMIQARSAMWLARAAEEEKDKK